MTEKVVDYSLYDVKGDRYDVKVTQREADVFERYPGRMYAKIMELKRLGQQPAKRSAPTRVVKKKEKSPRKAMKRPAAVSTPFKPQFNSTALQESQNLTSISPIVTPTAKKICEERADDVGNKSLTSRRQLSFAQGTDHLNESFDNLHVGDDPFLSEEDEKVYQHKTVIDTNSCNITQPISDLAGINNLSWDEAVPDEELLVHSPLVVVHNFFKLDFNDENKDTVKDFILKKMCDAGFIKVGSNCNCSASIKGSAAIILKFGTSEEANLAVLLEDISFFGTKLNIKKYNEEKVSRENSTHDKSVTMNQQPTCSSADINEKMCCDEESPDQIMLKNSPLVLVSGSDLNFSNENKDTVKDVKGFLLQRMCDAGFLSKGEDCIVNVSSQGPSSVIVKFTTCEEANLACLLEDVYFFGSKLNLSKYAIDSENNVLKNIVTPASTTDLDIYHGEGYYMYAQLLIKYRKDFPKNGAHDPVFKIILTKLQNKGVKCSLADLRIKRDRMKKLFNKKKKYAQIQHEFYAPGQVMFEGGDISLIKGSKYDPQHLGVSSCNDDNESSELSSDEDNDDLLKFSKVAVWTSNASMALLDNLLIEPDEYYKAGKRTNFWMRIQRLMVGQKFFYSADQCERRLEVLRSSYRNYYDENLRSGAAGPSFINADKDAIALMDKVGAFVNHRGPQGSQAKVSFSAGVKQQERRTDDSLPCKSCKSCSGNVSRVGKARPNVLSRALPSTKEQREERKVAALELKARALYRISRQGKCTNSSDDDEDNF